MVNKHEKEVQLFLIFFSKKQTFESRKNFL